MSWDEWNSAFSSLVAGVVPPSLAGVVGQLEVELAGRSPQELPGVLAVEDDVVVVDKPADWVVHDAGGDAPDLSAWLGGLPPAHRLDRGTSGLVLYARRPEVVAAVGEAHEKAYLTLVWGKTRPKGIIRRPLADGRRGRPLGATSRYRTIAQLGPVSYLRVRIETGRKHQIRRHLEGIGHPVVGDARYRGKGTRELPGAPDRLWLHAGQLALGDGRSWEAPLPPDLAAHLQGLREGT